MKHVTLALCAIAMSVTLTAFAAPPKESPEYGKTIATDKLEGSKYSIHDGNRPQPNKVEPGKTPGAPPADAVVLFDGTNLDHWVNQKGEPAHWEIKDGAMVASKGGGVKTKEGFGDCQLHIEWRVTDAKPIKGQNGSNSGVYLMDRYEIQVLESHTNKTYPDGQAGSIYGQYPPLVNASRPLGEWQTYDIIFEAPEFEGDKLVEPAYVTVLHNGVLLHHRQKIHGRASWKKLPTYAPHGPKEPLMLQWHSDPVEYRNIWIRPLDAYDE